SDVCSSDLWPWPPPGSAPHRVSTSPAGRGSRAAPTFATDPRSIGVRAPPRRHPGPPGPLLCAAVVGPVHRGCSLGPCRFALPVLYSHSTHLGNFSSEADTAPPPLDRGDSQLRRAWQESAYSLGWIAPLKEEAQPWTAPHAPAHGKEPWSQAYVQWPSR